jgi:hypothetical protein
MTGNVEAPPQPLDEALDDVFGTPHTSGWKQPRQVEPKREFPLADRRLGGARTTWHRRLARYIGV